MRIKEGSVESDSLDNTDFDSKLSDSENAAETKAPGLFHFAMEVKFLVRREGGQFCYTTMLAAALQWSFLSSNCATKIIKTAV